MASALDWLDIDVAEFNRSLFEFQERSMSAKQQVGYQWYIMESTEEHPQMTEIPTKAGIRNLLIGIVNLSFIHPSVI